MSSDTTIVKLTQVAPDMAEHDSIFEVGVSPLEFDGLCGKFRTEFAAGQHGTPVINLGNERVLRFFDVLRDSQVFVKPVDKTRAPARADAQFRYSHVVPANV